MTNFSKGDRVFLLAHPQTHGETVEINVDCDTDVFEICWDGGSSGCYKSHELGLVPFPIGTKVRSIGWMNETKSESVIAELCDIRFTIDSYKRVCQYHISEIRAAEDEKWVPRAGYPCFNIVVTDMGNFIVKPHEYNENIDQRRFYNGLIRQYEAQADAVVEAMLKAAKETV
jgi:hypothetical protein